LGQALGIGTDESNLLMGGGLIRSVGGSEMLAEKGRSEKQESNDQVLGDDSFVSSILSKIEEGFISSISLKNKGWNMKKCVIVICDFYKIDRNELLHKGRANSIGKAKSVVCCYCYDSLNYNGREISDFLIISESAVSKLSKKG